MKLRRMLAVTHETTLTGAPMNLLHLLRWIRRNTSIEVHLVTLQDGPLRHRFEEVCEVTVLDQSFGAGLLGVAQQGLIHLGSSRAWKPVATARLRPQLRHLSGYDLIYSNSIASSGILPYLPRGGVVVSHIHELQVALRTTRPREYLAALDSSDAWIAASAAVRDLLITERGYPAERVLLHYEYIDAREVANRDIPQRVVERNRRALDTPAECAVVVGAGTIDWRKGADLFVQLATEVRRLSREPVRFIWVGGDLVGTEWERIRSDIERTGSDHVRFIGVKPDPIPWFAMADVFALTSHEDPFPLVCLEHAARGVPVVTYRNGGMPELLEAAGPDAALGVADHMDVGGLARRVMAILDSEQLHRRAGEQLRHHVLEHHDVAVAAPRLLTDLDRLVGGQRPLPDAPRT